MKWYENWFDSKYYHTLYSNRNYTEAEQFIETLFNFIDLPKTAQVLDLACGRGRHSLFINKLGYDVIGLDLSENSINFAKQYENEQLKFDVWDMRKVYKSNHFDAIFNFFTSFGYFSNEDNQQIFNTIHSQLKNNGLFVMDFMNAKKVIANLVEQEIKTVDGIDFHLKRYVQDGKIHKEIQFEADENQYQFKEEVRIIELTEFLAFAMKAKFKHLHTFGDYQLNPFNEKESNRLVMIFEKV